MKTITKSFAGYAFILLLLWGSIFQANAQTPPAKTNSTVVQKKFASAQAAADALLAAAQTGSMAGLLEIFGPVGEEFVASSDPVKQKNNIATFVAKAAQKKSVIIDPQNKNRAILSVGNEDWPLPVPIVKKNNQWYFDSVAGRDEIRFRHIGENELDAIQVSRGYVEAQREYALEIHDSSGIHQYAQKILSTPGKMDGLYWKNSDGTVGGPVSEAVAKAIDEGFSPKEPTEYHGYYYRVLRGQGPAAPLGQLDYVINGAMIGGFALIGTPVEYGVTGVKTFMISHDGIVYEKDLGPDSLKLAKSIDRYNPDKTWTPTYDEWPQDLF